MNITPILESTFVIQLHTASVGLAAVLAFPQLILKKGTAGHRAVGIIWILAMLLGAISSFFIHTIPMFGPFSPIHLLSVLTLISVPMAWWAVRRGNILLHQRIMLSLVVFALLGAGIFTLVPGRLMNTVVFGS